MHTGSTHLACGDCSSNGACECRRLDTSDRRLEQQATRAVNTDFADDGLFFTFGSEDTNYEKALRWLGPVRCKELRADGEREAEQQRKATPGVPNSGTYNRVLAETIAAAHPDLAARARLETTTWLRSQFAALPLPSINSPAKESRTDMAHRDEADQARDHMIQRSRDAWRQPLGDKHTQPTAAASATRTDADEARSDARRTSHTAHAPTFGEDTSLTDTEQKTRLDVAEERYDNGQRREVYLRAYRTVARSDAKGGSGEQRVLARLAEILDEATEGELTSERATEASGLLTKLADLHGAVEEDESGLPAAKIGSGRTDAREKDDPADMARQRMNRRAQNAWREPLNKEGQEQLNIARLARED